MSNELKIDKARVLAEAEKCSTFKNIAKGLWPEVFDDYTLGVENFADFINNNKGFPFEWFEAMPGAFSKEKATLFFETYIKPNLKP